MNKSKEIEYEPQVAYAKLCYQAVYEFIKAKNPSHEPEAKNIESELCGISEKLKYLYKQIERAGYAIGSFYHRDRQILMPESVEWVTKAKFYLQQELLKNKAKNEDTVRKFLGSNNPKRFDPNFANLATDGAFFMLDLTENLPSTPLTKFYESQIETYKDVCDKHIQYILLFTLSDAVAKINQQNASLILRKLIVTNPHATVVKELLARKADPLARGEKTGLNAIDLAQRAGHIEIASMLRKHSGVVEEPSKASSPAP